MKCPKCGYPKAKYVLSKPKNEKTWIRKDFRAECAKCGFKFDASLIYDVIPSVKEKVEEERKLIEMKSEQDV